MTKYFQSFCISTWVFFASKLSAVDPAPLPPGFDPYEKKLPPDTSRFFGEFMYMLFVLGAVIGVLMFLSWYVKKMMLNKVTQINESSSIKITESRSLGPKSILHLIEVNGTEILIGETPAGITPIAKFKDDKSFEEFLSKDQTS